MTNSDISSVGAAINGASLRLNSHPPVFLSLEAQRNCVKVIVFNRISSLAAIASQPALGPFNRVSHLETVASQLSAQKLCRSTQKPYRIHTESVQFHAETVH